MKINIHRGIKKVENTYTKADSEKQQVWKGFRGFIRGQICQYQFLKSMKLLRPFRYSDKQNRKGGINKLFLSLHGVQ